MSKSLQKLLLPYHASGKCTIVSYLFRGSQWFLGWQESVLRYKHIYVGIDINLLPRLHSAQVLELGHT